MGLVAHWQLDETSGVLADVIGGHNLTVLGSCAPGNDGPAAPGWHFSGGRAVGDYAPFEAQAQGSMTIVLVVRVDDLTQGRVVYVGDGREAQDPFAVEVMSTSKLRFKLDSATESVLAQSDVVATETFLHVAAVLDDIAGTVSINVDGTVNTSALTISPSSGSTPHLPRW